MPAALLVGATVMGGCAVVARGAAGGVAATEI